MLLFWFDNTLLDEKLSKNILVYDISYTAFTGVKLLHIKLIKVDRFIKVYDGTRYLILFGTEKYDVIYIRIRYLISEKSAITYVYSYNGAIFKIDSFDSLPLERTLTLDTVVILIKSVFNKNKNDYYYNIFLEKSFYQLAEK